MKRIFLAIFLTIQAAGVLCQSYYRIGGQKVFDKEMLVSFSLQTTTGKHAHLRLSSKKITVFVFLSPECPLSKNYSLKLSELKKKYEGQVSFIGIIPGKFDSKEVAEFKKDYFSSWTFFQDNTLKLTHYLQGKVTPEVLVINSKSGYLIYYGAIDDWAVSPGKTRSQYANFYLDNALDDFLNNRKIMVSYNKPVGCFINEF